MTKRCEIKNCNKVGKYFYENKLVCKNHVCRCNNPNKSDSWFNGCGVHKK